RARENAHHAAVQAPLAALGLDAPVIEHFRDIAQRLAVSPQSCFSESFESLREGLQNALWELGCVPGNEGGPPGVAACSCGGGRHGAGWRAQAAASDSLARDAGLRRRQEGRAGLQCHWNTAGIRACGGWRSRRW